MNTLIIFSFLVCIVALVLTLKITKSEDGYNSTKSLTTLSFAYVFYLPIIVLVIVGLFWLFM